ncbi:MAG: response regulator, partial [Thermoguttaceae bacterium]
PVTFERNLSPSLEGASSVKILCIDDDTLIGKSIAARLRTYGIEVKVAKDGTTGYLQAISNRPDVILLDLQMPNGDGQYTLAKLREHSRTKDIPVVMLSAETHPGVQRKLMGLGAAGYLCKPLNWENFFIELARYVHLPDKLIQDYNLSENHFAQV